MGLIDSHAHLTYPELGLQIDAVLARCADAGVDRIITIGTDLADGRRAIELAMRHPTRIRAGVGFHPHHAEAVADGNYGAMAELWGHPLVVAAGEMGLDYHYDFADRAIQRSVFAKQLESARGLSLPLIIHCSDAFEDAVLLLCDHGFRDRYVVFHCFTGTEAEVARAAECGWRISFTGIVTFRDSTALQGLAKAYPETDLMIETDSPYLSPVPVRGRRPNEPANLVHTARFLADLRGVPFETLVEQTSRNTERFFGM